jgi:hypothetical protein
LALTTGQFDPGSAFDTLFDNTENFTRLPQVDLSAIPREVLDELEASGCQAEWLQFLWHFTGGFFLSLVAIPVVSTAQVRTGVYGIIMSSQAGRSAVQTLLSSITSNKAISAGVIASFMSDLYEEGLLPQVLRMALSLLGWWAAAAALTKIISAIFAPGLQAAVLLSSFTVWAIQGVDIALALSACGGSSATDPETSSPA